MEYFNRIICVTVDELTRSGDGEAVMSLPNYKQLVARKRVNVIRKAGGLGSYALIEYATMPARFRERYEAKYGKPEDILKEQSVTDILLRDDKAFNFYASHVLPTGECLPDSKIDEYTMNASVLNEVVKILNDRTALRKALGHSPQNVWQTIVATVDGFRENPGHTLPSNPARLKQKIKEYRDGGYACLISGKFGNENTLKITEEAGNLIIALRRSRVPVYTYQQIFDEFNAIAEKSGWKPLKSVATLVQFLTRPDIEPMWYDAVHGELAAKGRYQRRHKTELPAMRDALWYSDGTKLNLYYKAYENNRLVVKTTSVYEVMDAYSEALLGYHISDTENFETQYRAFRMAIETSGCRPFEIVNDNQGGHKKLENGRFFERISRVSRRTAPYNGPSKSIEAAFGRFQAQVLHRDWRFTGQNITARSENSRPNLEFIEANKENLYTYEELCEAYARYRQEWNEGLHPQAGRPRIEMYRDSVNPDLLPVDQLDMIEMFWVMTSKPSTFTTSGITIQVKNQKYTYEVFDQAGMPDMEFRRNNTLRQFYVMYDPLDMTMVRLYTKDASGYRYAATAHPYMVIHRALQEQQPGEMAFIRQMDAAIKRDRVERQIAAAELEYTHGVAPEQHGLNRPRIKGISEKAFEASADSQRRASKAAAGEAIGAADYGKMISNVTYEQVASRYDKY